MVWIIFELYYTLNYIIELYYIYFFELYYTLLVIKAWFELYFKRYFILPVYLASMALSAHILRLALALPRGGVARVAGGAGLDAIAGDALAPAGIKDIVCC